MTTQTAQNYKIKSVKGDLIVVTEGMQLMSVLSKKSDLTEALQTSLAHKWLLEQAIKTKPKLVSSIPSTDTTTFKTKAFYYAVKLVVENLVEIEGLTIQQAISQGNLLAKGSVIVADSQLVMSQIKDALRYLN